MLFNIGLINTKRKDFANLGVPLSMLTLCSKGADGKLLLLLAGSPLQFETRQLSTLKKGSRETKKQQSWGYRQGCCFKLRHEVCS